MTHSWLAIIVALSFLAFATADLSCLDRNNNPVPWFTLLKFPGNVSNYSSVYAYLDPNSGSQYEIISTAYPDQEGEAMPNTIAAINSLDETDSNVLIFNDEPPTLPWDPYGGHAKGIIAYDSGSQTGVYILHSFPKFPTVSTNDGSIDPTLPGNTYVYGQNAYCISLDSDSFNALLTNLPVEWPNAYYSSGLFKTMNLTSDDMQQVSQFALLDGENQWFLTKSPNSTGFLYENIVAPYFKIPLAVESWGRPYQNPVCPSASGSASDSDSESDSDDDEDEESVVNIDQIALNSQYSWGHYSDHSKWAISNGGSVNVACFCDINRMYSQEERGGSCLCSENAAIYEALSKIVVSRDQC